ncbi:MAG: AraC family transcriptional regulator [Bacteroidetes bacterium]|nr:MAG: AraC family transcriptional regulator [Bacteroidota bacterium]
MYTVELEETKLVGLALKEKTTNVNEQSSIDCGNLWQEFEKGKYAEMIPNKLTEEILAVYHQYEGDHTQPFSYFIGCKVKPGTEVPAGLETLTIAKGTYQRIDAKGKMPDCVANAWKEIWVSDIPRSYKMDFEVYDEKSKDWNDAEVEVYLSVES